MFDKTEEKQKKEEEDAIGGWIAALDRRWKVVFVTT
jgi:hypothetical protein